MRVSFTTRQVTTLLYFAAGQAGWFACVLSAARHCAWVGALFSILCIAIHLSRVAKPSQEAKLVASVAVIGGIWESGLVYCGFLSYPSGSVIHGVAPYWIVVLWALFAAQLNTTYDWLKSRAAIAALLGAIAGPASFRAGAALGALTFLKLWPAAVAIALGWAVILPAVVLLAKRWNGVQPPAADHSKSQTELSPR